MGKSWKNPHKVAKAAAKGAIISKVAKEIMVATKLGGPDPSHNARLRIAIEAAKEVSCPTDTIERAIKKGSGQLDDGSQIEEIIYEGYGPHGVGVIIECQTDNRHRTAPEIRHMFKSHGGNMGESGSVQWMFSRVGIIEGKKTGSFDPEEEAIEAGANEVFKNDDGSYIFYVNLDDLDTVRTNLTTRKWAISKCEPGYKASNITELSAEQLKEVQEFLGEVEDFDDTHRLYATLA